MENAPVPLERPRLLSSEMYHGRGSEHEDFLLVMSRILDHEV